MIQYHNFLQSILDHGTVKSDRTGTGTISLFGPQMEFDLSEGFPLVTTKKMATKAVISELLWFLEGSTDERRLAEIHYGKPREELIGKQTIWTANADAQGKDLGYINTDTVKELGPVYGSQWRRTPKYFKEWVKEYEIGEDGYEYHGHGHNELRELKIDQITNVIESIKSNPDSRRHIVSAWNVSEIDQMALPPCHTMFQFYVANGKLDCKLYQRSADAFLGVPFNIASYALLTMMIAQVCDLEPGRFIHTFGDAHIYLNHIDQVKEQLSRDPYKHQLPEMVLDLGVKSIDEFDMDSFILTDYESYPAIKAEMAV